MPAPRTEVTEIVTGLGMLGFPTLEAALAARPAEMINVHDTNWDGLNSAFDSRHFTREFDTAWSNGRAFFEANCGLRGRRPLRVEWKGQYQTPGYDSIPADLRIDHVFLISCKYLSRVLHNVSPSHLFDRVLADRKTSDRSDWYLEAAPDAFRVFYSEVRREMAPEMTLPKDVVDLEECHRAQLSVNCMVRGDPD